MDSRSNRRLPRRSQLRTFLDSDRKTVAATVRFLASALAAVLVAAACSDDDDPVPAAPPASDQPADQQPAPSGNPASAATTWTTVRLEDQREQGAACTSPQIIEIRDDNSYSIETCDAEDTGSFAAEEFARINNLIEDVIRSGLNEDRLCLELAYMGRRTLDLTLDDGRRARPHEMSREGSCFTSDQAKVNELERALFDLIPGEETATDARAPATTLRRPQDSN